MSKLESGSATEKKVGVKRHVVDHLGRAVSPGQRVYVLHSQECKDSGIDLRKCEYSIALDLGIDMEIWGQYQDVPVLLSICPDGGDILPVPFWEGGTR